MSKSRLLICFFPVGAWLVATGPVSGQTFPSKAIRIIASEAGAGTDFVARIVAQGLTAAWNQSVIVDNRPSGVIPGELLSKAAPDGHTLLVGGSALWIGPLLRPTPYDALRDFAAVTLTTTSPNILVVNPALPVKSVKELIVLARARPGDLNYATAGTGSSPHLAAELFKAMARVNFVRVNYKSGAFALTDLIAGQVQLIFPTAISVAPHIASGRLHALGVTSAKPSALAPGLPAIAESGLPGYESVTVFGIFAPANTPGPAIAALNREIVQFIAKPDVKERFFKVGTEVVASSPDQFISVIKAEMTTMGKVIKEAGIREE